MVLWAASYRASRPGGCTGFLASRGAELVRGRTVERDPVLALLKIGAAEHMRQLLVDGNLYMQPIACFRKLESDLLRCDRDEGLTASRAATGAVMSVQREAEWHSLGTLAGPLRFRADDEAGGNVFCMFALRGNHFDGFIDRRILDFGDSVVVFTKGDEFLTRFLAAAEREGFKPDWRLVDYVDAESYSGAMGPFRKFSRFAYQSEFRLVARPDNAAPRSLLLGSLEDIAMLIPASEIENKLAMVRDEGRLRARLYSQASPLARLFKP